MGLSKEKYRHLLNMTCALLFQSNVHISCWGECIMTITYLINKISTPVLQNRTPHKLVL